VDDQEDHAAHDDQAQDDDPDSERGPSSALNVRAGAGVITGLGANGLVETMGFVVVVLGLKGVARGALTVDVVDAAAARERGRRGALAQRAIAFLAVIDPGRRADRGWVMGGWVIEAAERSGAG